MIEVPIDKIITLDDAVSDISKYIESAVSEKSLYVLTKEGKPYAALVDVNLLEHLPEMNTSVETQPIKEIGGENPPAPVQTDAAEEQISSEFSENIINPQPPAQENILGSENNNSDTVLDENIGPWQDNNNSNQFDNVSNGDSGEENNLKEPPDLQI